MASIIPLTWSNCRLGGRLAAAIASSSRALRYSLSLLAFSTWAATNLSLTSLILDWVLVMISWYLRAWSTCCCRIWSTIELNVELVFSVMAWKVSRILIGSIDDGELWEYWGCCACCIDMPSFMASMRIFIESTRDVGACWGAARGWPVAEILGRVAGDDGESISGCSLI